MELSDIKDPNAIKPLNIAQLEALAASIRQFLIESISQTGGHLSSNLGVVELTIALHKVFDSPSDAIIFDVGHQGYVHKILTGRADRFSTLRQTDGLSGFLKREESAHDVFEAGHAATSLAAGAGMLYAKDITHEEGEIVMVIGDGALASGMALEALNFMGHDRQKAPIIILNDNEMSIGQNIGYFSKLLTKIRLKRSYRLIRKATKKLVPSAFRGFGAKVERRLKTFISGHSTFEDLGYQYYGPIDGHKFSHLLKAFTVAKEENKPCIVHVKTVKGKGYAPSEDDTTGKYHGVKPFDIDTGEARHDSPGVRTMSRAVADYLTRLATRRDDLMVITPAMISGSELEGFMAAHPTRLIDVGIAEQTAATMAAGMALKGIKPFLSIYSTFLQRAYDQVLHDIARHNANVVIGVDRAGLVGADGDTHQGIYDIPMMSHIPNLTIAHPKDVTELYGILNHAFHDHQGPIAIRYARIALPDVSDKAYDTPPIAPSWDVIIEGEVATLITFGEAVMAFHEKIRSEKLPIRLINARYIKPLDEALLDTIDTEKPVFIVEESTIRGGLGEAVLSYLIEQGRRPAGIKLFGFRDAFVPHGNRNDMLKRYGLDVESVLTKVRETLAS